MQAIIIETGEPVEIINNEQDVIYNSEVYFILNDQDGELYFHGPNGNVFYLDTDDTPIMGSFDENGDVT